MSSQPPPEPGEPPPGPVISPAELAELLASADRPVVLDVRWRLGGPPGIDSYLAGHLLGCTSDAWLYQLAHVDKLAEQLASALPHGTLLLVTADHGMVDVANADRTDADTVPGLRDGVVLLGGEARVRHLYCTEGAAADVLATWRGVLGDLAWVVSREQAVSDGWFGPVREANLARIGDVIVACCGPSAVIASKTEPRESKMVGLHGSLTQAEQLVPLLTFTTG